MNDIKSDGFHKKEEIERSQRSVCASIATNGNEGKSRPIRDDRAPTDNASRNDFSFFHLLLTNFDTICRINGKTFSFFSECTISRKFLSFVFGLANSTTHSEFKIIQNEMIDVQGI